MAQERVMTEAEFGLRLGDQLMRTTFAGEFLLSALQLCYAAYETASIKMLHDIIRSAPRPVVPGDVCHGKVSSNTPAERPPDLSELGFIYFFREKTVGDVCAGKAMAEAFDIAQEKVTQAIKAYEDALSEPQRRRLHERDDTSYANEICRLIPEADTLREMDDFFCRRLINVNDDARQIIDLSLSSFLFGLLNDPEIYPPSSDGTPMTLRAKYAIDLDNRLTQKVIDHVKQSAENETHKE
ncbi:MAG: hypothetical protein INR73_17405 [Williamsia sp.]|nr:hypothetical protein [Williamsia sp.]